jgi:hypothetical protein
VKERLSDQQTAAPVPATDRRVASDPRPRRLRARGGKPLGEWVDREIWTERMLAALATASKQGKGAYFAAQGLFTMSTARRLASQPR